MQRGRGAVKLSKNTPPCILQPHRGVKKAAGVFISNCVSVCVCWSVCISVMNRCFPPSLNTFLFPHLLSCIPLLHLFFFCPSPTCLCSFIMHSDFSFFPSFPLSPLLCFIFLFYSVVVEAFKLFPLHNKNHHVHLSIPHDPLYTFAPPTPPFQIILGF